MAAEQLRGEARSGRLEARSVEAVLHAAGHRSRTSVLPAGLTEREIDVLVLLSRGETNRSMARQLGISSKTVGTTWSTFTRRST